MHQIRTPRRTIAQYRVAKPLIFALKCRMLIDPLMVEQKVRFHWPGNRR